jgi:hypothetical protein
MNKILLIIPLIFAATFISFVQQKDQVKVFCHGGCDDGNLREFHVYKDDAKTFLNQMLIKNERQRGKNVVFHFKKQEIPGIEAQCTISMFEGIHHVTTDFKEVFYPFRDGADRQARLANLKRDKRSQAGIVVHVKVSKLEEIDTKEEETAVINFITETIGTK